MRALNLFSSNSLKTIQSWLSWGYWGFVVAYGYLMVTALYFVIFPKHSILSFVESNDIGTSRSLIIFLILGIVFTGYLCWVYQKKIRTNFLIFLLATVLALISIIFREKSVSLDYISIDLLALSISIFSSLTFLFPIINRLRKFRFIIFLPFILVLLGFLSLSLFRHFSLNSHAFDLGLYNQAFYKMAHFDFDNTIRNLPNIWGDHFTPLFLPLSWLYWAFPYSATLLIVQSAVVVLGGIPLYLLSKDVLKSRAAGLFVASTYLLSIGLASAISFDFHFITIATSFLFLAFYFAYKRKWVWYFISLILLLSCKEDISIIVVFVGIFLAFFRDWRVGLTTSLIGAIWFIVISKFVMPNLSTEGFVYFTYSTLGPTPFLVVKNFLLNPLHAISALYNSATKQITLLNDFGSLSFIPFFAPTLFIIALPALGENLWNDAPARWAGFHYEAFSSAVFAIIAVFAIYNLSHLVHEKYRLKVIIFLAFLCLISTIFVDLYARTPLLSIFKTSHYGLSSEVKQAYSAISIIPKDASVTANDSMVPHLAFRNEIYGYPRCKSSEKCLKTDYFVLSLAGSPWPMGKEEEVREVKYFLNRDSFRSEYGLVNNDGSTFVFKRDYQPDPSKVLEAINFLNAYKIPQDN